MESKRVILTRFVDFAVTLWQLDVRILFLLKNSWKTVFSINLPQFYIFHHFLSK